MAQAHELVVVLGILPQTAQRDGHAVLQHPIQLGLGTVRLLKIVKELLGGGGEFQLLRRPPESGPVLFNLLDGGLASVLELHEDRGHVAVLTGDTEALGGDGRAFRLDDFAVFHVAPQLQRLLLGLFLLAADVGDAVIHHLRPALEGFTGAGNGLIGANQRAFQTVFQQGMEGRHIALERAVALDGNEAPFGAKTHTLGLNDLQMLGVDLRHHHGNVVRPAICRVVGNNGTFQFGVFLLQCVDLFLLHIHSAEAEVYHTGQLLGIRFGIQHHQRFCFLRAGNIQRPAATNGFPIRLPGALGAGGNGGELEPGVIFQQGHKPLTHHARAADDADLILFHNRFLLQPP